MKAFVCSAAMIALASSAHAGVIDWANGPEWADSTLGPVIYSSDGVDATVSVLDPNNVRYNQFPTAGENLGLSSMWLAGQFASGPLSHTMTMSISFSSAVTEVSFVVYDFDGTGGAMDQVTLSGSMGATSGIASSASLGANIDQLDAYTFRADGTTNGDVTDAGVVATFTFAGPVDSITLDYTNTQNNQGILIGDVSFTVPAPSSALVLSALAFGAARRRR